VRIATVGWLRHRDSGNKVVVANTHLDHQGVVARREAARLLRKKIAEWMWKDDEREENMGGAGRRFE